MIAWAAVPIASITARAEIARTMQTGGATFGCDAFALPSP